MGYLKARSLKHGYIDPEELIRRLRELKPSDNFTLRKHRHPWMQWDKSPIRERPHVKQPPDSDWFLHQIGDIGLMRRQLGKRSTECYQQEARDHWDKVCDIELTPFPDLHLLKDMGRSPSGTLCPRYLVKGLHELRERANDRGGKYYDEEYEKAIVKRREVIHRWQDENSDSILADDPVSIYKTWPSELMDQLDTVDQEAMRRGSERYITDLRETEKKMLTLVAFWRYCGLVTGQRTPPSPQWPDPKAKLRGKHWPDYVMGRLMAFDRELGDTNECTKRRFIEITRWKEAILSTDSEPSPSDTPFPQSLMDELDIVWQGYDFLKSEETEDEMIVRITRWRKSKYNKSCPDRPQTPLPSDTNASPEEMIEKTRSSDSIVGKNSSDEHGECVSWMHRRSLSVSANNESIDLALCREHISPLTDQSSVTTADMVDHQLDLAIPRSSSTSRSGDSLHPLKTPSKKSRALESLTQSSKRLLKRQCGGVGFGLGKRHLNHPEVRPESLKAS